MDKDRPYPTKRDEDHAWFIIGLTLTIYFFGIASFLVLAALGIMEALA